MKKSLLLVTIVLLIVCMVGGVSAQFSNCGDDYCNGLENCISCPVDCSCTCGDFICTQDEPGSCFGDGCCEFDDGGDESEPCCGDFTCDTGEDCISCPLDCYCTPICGDDICDHDIGENCDECEADCGACYCQDGDCNDEETCVTCGFDCACYCGDGVCTEGETCADCPDDCGSCPTLSVPEFPILSLPLITIIGLLVTIVAVRRMK